MAKSKLISKTNQDAKTVPQVVATVVAKKPSNSKVIAPGVRKFRRFI